MNLELAQLRALLEKYRVAFNDVKDEYDDPEYLAWISTVFDKEQWPEVGEFIIARDDPVFRVFRSVYKQCREAMMNFVWDVMPYATRTEYQKKCVEETGEVPF